MKYKKSIKTWIAKPASGLQGRGILISSSPQRIINHILKSKDNEWLLSQYIDNPFLLKLQGTGKSGLVFNDRRGRKTHIRIYVLITSLLNEEIKIYLYEDNLIFAAVKEYTKSNKIIEESTLTNLFVASKYYNLNLINAN